MVVTKLNMRAKGAGTYRKPARHIRLFQYTAILLTVILLVSLGISLGYISKLKFTGVTEGAGYVFECYIDRIEKHPMLVTTERQIRYRLERMT